MRTRIFLLLLISVCALNCGAQLRYGLRIGGDINTSTVKDLSEYSTKHLSGFSGGLTLEYQFGSSPWAIDGSVVYTYTGVELKGDNDAKWKTGNDFLQVPVHVKYKFWLTSVKQLAGPYLYTGPSFMARLDKDTAGSPLPTRRAQIGWNLGAGIDIVNFIQIQAGYRFGLNNVATNGMTMHNDGVNISVALLFDF